MLDFVDLLSRVPEKEVAKLFKKTTRYVRDLAADGILVRVAPGIYDLGAALPVLVEKRASKTADERLRLAAQQADNWELKNAQLRGELLPAVEVEQGWSNLVSDAKARLLAVPTRVQQRIAHLTAHDVAEIEMEIREALTALAAQVDDDGKLPEADSAAV